MATIITKNSSTASSVPAAGSLQQGELAVNVTDKKLYTKDSSAAVVKLVGSLGNQEANAVAITGGTINGTAIGGTTPAAAAFTTASASGGFTGNLTGNASTVTNGVYTTGSYADPAWITSLAGSKITGNISGNAANVTGTVAIANGGTGLTALGTGVQTALGQTVTGSGGIVLAASPSLTTPNLGTPSAVTLTNATGLPVSTGISGLGTNVATALGVSVGSVGSVVVNGGALGTPSSGTLTNATGLPLSTGVTGTLAVANGGTGITAFGSGVATALGVNVGSAGAFVVNGGALGTPSSGTVTNLTGTASININGTVGATTPNTGSFTTLTTSSTVTHNGGTANGVAYLNGSKVLTTGSALTFNGTTFSLATGGVASIYDSSVNNRINLGADASGAYIQSTFSSGGSTDLRFLQAATEAMRLTSTGLGIGTSSPDTKLDVRGNAVIGARSGYAELALNSLSSSVSARGASFRKNWDSPFDFNIYSSNGASGSSAATVFYRDSVNESMRIDSSGNVGIGTSSPSVSLEVLRSGNAYGLFRGGSATVAQGVTVGQNTAGDALLYNGYSLGSLQFGTNGTERARFTSGGDLGVGTTSPSQRLDATVNTATEGSGLAVTNSRVDGYGSGLSFYSTATDSTKILAGRVGMLGTGTWANTANASSAMAFSTVSGGTLTERARITSAGDVGIGTSSPGQALAIYRGSGVSGGIEMAGNANTLGSTSFFVGQSTSGDGYVYQRANAPLYLGTNNTNRVIITATGDVGIGTSSPGQRLTIQSAATGTAPQMKLQNPVVADSTQTAANGLSAGQYLFGATGGLPTAASIEFLYNATDASFGRNGVLRFSTIDGTNAVVEKMALNTNGNLGLGVTPSAWGGGTKAIDIGSRSAIYSGGAGQPLIANNFYFNGTNNIYKASAAATAYQQLGGAHEWYTAPSGTAGTAISFTQALTLDASRNLLLNGTTAGASSVGTLTIFNGTAPTGSVTDGVILFAADVSSSSELRVRDEAGNVTTLSPHNFELIPEGPSEDMAWAYYSEKNGKKINVDMLKLARMVEKLTGEKLVYEA